MGQEEDRQRANRDRIERLRKRLEKAASFRELIATLKGILDLLEDEL
jgi:hypothetical protein